MRRGRAELMTTRKLAKTIGVGVIGVVVLWGAWQAVLRFTGLNDPNACISEQLKTIPDLSGTKVDIVYTNCDTLAKQEDVSVYFSPAVVKGKSWFAKWTNRRTLVFRYDPGRPDNPLPSITHPSQSTILISIPEVSSIFYQNRKWENISVNYEIGRVDYPPATK
jgi:hypothetical protein